MVQQSKTKTSVLRSRAWAWSSHTVSYLATRIVRLVVIVMFVLLTLYLSYDRVWQSFFSVTPLPPGVTVKNPELSLSLLKTIANQQLERTGASTPAFFVSKYFRAENLGN